MRLESLLYLEMVFQQIRKDGENADRCFIDKKQGGAMAKYPLVHPSVFHTGGVAHAGFDKYTVGLKISFVNIRSTNINEDASH